MTNLPPFSQLPVPPDGLAVLVRRKGRPVGFWMQPEERRLITAEELSAALSAEAGSKIVEDVLREELATKLPARPEIPSLTIAICSKDRPEMVGRCLERLRNVVSKAPCSADIEILVIDNAPSDARTRNLVLALSDVRYVEEPRPGLDFARNRAIAEAKGELLAYLDDDVVPDHGWLVGLAEAFGENPDAGCFTGLVLPFELKTRAQILFERRGGFRRGFTKLRYQGQDLDGNPLYPCGAGIFGAGCNMVFRREIVELLGGFDEALDTGPSLPGGGDLDMFYRVIRSGQALVYEPRMLVFHEHRREDHALLRQYGSWGLGFMAFLAKARRHDPSRRSRLRRTTIWWFKDQFRQLARSITGRHVLPPKLVLAELLGGIRGLCGTYNRSCRRRDGIRNRFP